jgi:hypothetical protein
MRIGLNNVRSQKTEVMPVLFNNCHSRPHAELYGLGAFYDLNRVGAQANMATDLQPGQHCCVATPAQNGDIEFGWFRFTHEQLMDMPDEPGTTVQVLFGEWLGSESLPRTNAVATEPYAEFFNVNGHFKRPSVIRPKGNCTAPASVRRG